MTTTNYNFTDLKDQHPYIYNEIFESNTYRVNTQEILGKNIVDIGANYGFFSLYCAANGAARILAVEASPKNYHQLYENVKSYSNITPINRAVMDLDNDIVTINDNGGESQINLDSSFAVPTVTLETVINDHFDQTAPLVLKMDCESSEFDILLNCSDNLIQRFSTIYIELHNNHVNPEYRDVNMIRNLFVKNNFRQEFSNETMFYYYSGEVKPMGIFTEKWVKNTS